VELSTNRKATIVKMLNKFNNIVIYLLAIEYFKS